MLVPVACESVCHDVPLHQAAMTQHIAKDHPEVVAELWKLSNLESGTYAVSLTICTKVCGDAVIECSFDANFANRERAEGKLDCVFAHDDQCSLQIWSPVGHSACVYGCGRLPDGVVAELGRRHRDPVVQHLAEIALLEALSVSAFTELEADLSRFQAPIELRRRARVAANDERRHARLARATLRRLGVRASMPPKLRRCARTLEAVARSNAIDGCVRETFGALLGSVQAARAGDPSLRAFFAAIEVDEHAHAVLAWDVHRALSARLGPAARARIAVAQRAALEELLRFDTEVPKALQARAGAPTTHERRALAAAFARTLPFEVM